MDSETTATDQAVDQDDLVQQLVHSVARSWAETFERPEFLRYNNLTERLDGVAHSVLVELDGDGGVQPHRLAPKTDPARDLLGGARSACPHPDECRSVVDPDTRAFVDKLRSLRNQIVDTATQTGDDDPRHVVGLFLVGICKVLEGDYVLVPQFFDDDGDFESEGLDIAPGLTAAFGAEWALTEG